jgi:hypothetical protein
MAPPSCGARLLIEHGQVWLGCSALPGHTGTHTAYYRDRLHEWPAPNPPKG